METVLEAKRLSKSYGKKQEIEVLRNIDLKIKKGEFLVIMGKSGSGKSTLLYNISGMDRATSGDVIINNQSLFSLSDDKISKFRLENMGFVFQHAHLLKMMTIKENIMIPALKLNKKPYKEIVGTVEDLLERVEIQSIQDNDITQVSGGQLQRAAICRALINQPDIIFGDEPTGALNSKASDEVMNLFKEINDKGITVVLVTHDTKVASRADRVVYLLDGCIESEYTFDKYSGDNQTLKGREEQIIDWLSTKAF